MPLKRRRIKKQKQTPSGSNQFNEDEQTACLSCEKPMPVQMGIKVEHGWVCGEECKKVVSSKSELTKSEAIPYKKTRAAKISNSLIGYRERMQLNAKTVKEFAVKNTANLLDAKIALMGAVRLVEEQVKKGRD